MIDNCFGRETVEEIIDALVSFLCTHNIRKTNETNSANSFLFYVSHQLGTEQSSLQFSLGSVLYFLLSITV